MITCLRTCPIPQVHKKETGWILMQQITSWIVDLYEVLQTTLLQERKNKLGGVAGEMNFEFWTSMEKRVEKV